MTQVPEQGDFIYMNFNPQAGHEQAGRRPALVMSPARFNEKTGFVFVCPITNQKKNYPFEIDIPEGSGVSGVILTDQMKSLDWKSRDLRVKGKAPAVTLMECSDLIKTILQMDD